MAHTSSNEVVIIVTEVKWENMRSLVLDLEALMSEDKVPHKRLKCINGFLVYVARTYTWIMQYL